MKKHVNSSPIINEKLQETFLHSIGSSHALNIIENISSIKENQSNEFYPTSLDDWFKDYLNQKNSMKKQSIKKNLYKRIAILFSGIIVGAVLLSLNSEAFKLNLYTLFIKTTQIFSEITYDDSSNIVELLDDLPERWSGYYPTILPLGYELSSSLESSSGKYLIFTNNLKQDFIMIQGSLEIKVLIDSEDALSYEVDINGLEGMIFEKSELKTLIWADNVNSFYLIGNVDKETMVKIASTMKYKK